MRPPAPLIVADGFVTHESSGRRAANVLVYGVDERFWAFHGLRRPTASGSRRRSRRRSAAKEGDVLLTRLQKPSEIPIESLFGRKEDVGRTVRLTLAGVLPRDRLGEFSLQPQQAEVRAVFAPLRRIQRDLAVPGQVNTVLVAGGERDRTRDSEQRSRSKISACASRRSDSPTAIIVDSSSGIVSDALERAARSAAGKLGLQPMPVFTYLANAMRKGDRAIPYSLITATDLSPALGRLAER